MTCYPDVSDQLEPLIWPPNRFDDFAQSLEALAHLERPPSLCTPRHNYSSSTYRRTGVELHNPHSVSVMYPFHAHWPKRVRSAPLNSKNLTFNRLGQIDRRHTPLHKRISEALHTLQGNRIVGSGNKSARVASINFVLYEA